MATVHKLSLLRLQVEAKHTDVEATYSLVKDREGRPLLQIDTYGSKSRQIAGKKSQSIRFTAEAIEQLKAIIDTHFDRASDR
jgi:hypothetical protein